MKRQSVRGTEKAKGGKPDPRDRILDAAEAILYRQGLAATTLDMVAAEAGVSKGGLLHYFPNKRELYSASLARFEERFFARRDAILARLPEMPGRLARATMQAIGETRGSSYRGGHYRVDILEDIGYRRQIGVMKRRLFDDLLHGSRRPDRVLVALYMMDGIWLDHFFDPSPVPKDYAAKAKKWLHSYMESLFTEYD